MRKRSSSADASDSMVALDTKPSHPMSPELEEFRQRVLAHAKVAVSRSVKVDSEAKTNTSLVQPFLTTLGYDVGDLDEVSPEHHADFSEKYQNKVDYAILVHGTPVIAIETKRAGAEMRDDRGQLRSYFNACPTVKLGILTDGLKYEFYADSDKPNMMDEAAFLRFDLSAADKTGTMDDNTLLAIAAIRNGLFNPEDVGAEAKRKILFDSVLDIIKRFKAEPSDDFVRLILACSVVGSKIPKITQKIVETNREIVRSAMEAFVTQEALARFGYAPKDVFRTPPAPVDASIQIAAPLTTEPEVQGIRPSEDEHAAFAYIRDRLLYLIQNEVLFKEVGKIQFRKTRANFRIYYDKPNNGSLCDYRENKGAGPTAQFHSPVGREIPYVVGQDLDDCLLNAFTQRAREAGVSLDSLPALRSIPGGKLSESA